MPGCQKEPWSGDRPLVVLWGAWYPEVALLPSALQVVHMGACLVLLPNALSWAWCTVKPNKTKMSEFGVEKGVLQGRARRQVAHAP